MKIADLRAANAGPKPGGRLESPMPLSFRASMQLIDFMWLTEGIFSPVCGAREIAGHSAYGPQPVQVATRFSQNDINALKCFGCIASSKTKWHWARKPAPRQLHKPGCGRTDNWSGMWRKRAVIFWGTGQCDSSRQKWQKYARCSFSGLLWAVAGLWQPGQTMMWLWH